MLAIVSAIHTGGKYTSDPHSYVRSALIKLAVGGYVLIGRKVRLTRKGKEMAAAARTVQCDGCRCCRAIAYNCLDIPAPLPSWG